MNDAAVGYGAAAVAVICFGSNFLPLKGIKVGDGVFFQFIMCNAVFMTSIPVLIIQDFPPVHGLAIAGGFLWCTGNMLCPVAIRFVGMGMGLILWGCTSMVIGWASGKFGLFGLARQEISDEVLNYIGVLLSILGLVVYVQVKTVDVSKDAQAYQILQGSETDTFSPLLLESGAESKGEERLSESPHEPHRVSFLIDNKLVRPGVEQEVSFGDNWSEEFKRFFGIAAACGAGLFFGVSFDPSQYTIDNKYDGNDNVLNYVFSQYLGILATSWFYTIMYCVYCRYHNQKPYVSAEIILPGTLSGLIWGLAETAYFIANGKLGFPISFPIIAAGPGFVGAMYGVFVFKEITGRDNLRMLGLAMCITIPALVLVGISH
ncbi:CEO family-domain-containing protein [Ochromonadaceae sp. CCMP2298]|nr:CEO family-domain-containing protein [Ochromonadaceae sp. CCMP2298]